MITIDLIIVKKIALFIIAIVPSFWFAYKLTPDLNEVEHRFWYRWAYAMVWVRGTIAAFQLFGWL